MGETAYENIVIAHTHTRRIRVWFWRDVTGPLLEDDFTRLLVFCEEHHTRLESGDPFYAARLIAEEMVNVNAVEVTMNGLGAVVYNNWP